MSKPLIINVDREGYTVDQVSWTMTVGEIIAYLEQFDEDTKVYVSHDKGYTYGGIRETSFEDETGHGDPPE
jgi:hypothetical protein